MTEAEMALRAKVETLTKQLVAARNDAARAELRAKDVSRLLAGFADVTWLGTAAEKWLSPEERAACAFLAAAPDSDARLREVLAKAAFRGIVCGESRGAAGIFDDASRENDAKFIVDEALRGGA